MRQLGMVLVLVVLVLGLLQGAVHLLRLPPPPGEPPTRPAEAPASVADSPRTEGTRLPTSGQPLMVRVLSLDLTDPLAPVLVGMSSPIWSPVSPLAVLAGGYTVYPLQESGELRPLAVREPLERDTGAGEPGVLLVGQSPGLRDHHAYMTLSPAGLRILDPTAPGARGQERVLELPGTAHGFLVRGTYAYVVVSIDVAAYARYDP